MGSESYEPSLAVTTHLEMEVACTFLIVFGGTLTEDKISLGISKNKHSQA
jgi:hypothetical protein